MITKNSLSANVKGQADAMNAAGFENADELAKVKEWQGRMREFIRQTGLQRQGAREQFIKSSKLRESSVLRENPISGASSKGRKENSKKDFSSITLSEFEKEIVTQDFETAGLFSKDGKIIFFKHGDESELRFTDEEMEKMVDGILVHNHPHSLPFSPDDIMTMITGKLDEIRVVGTEHSYIMKNTQTGKKLDHFRFKLALENAIASVRSQPEEANMSDSEYLHAVWTQLAKLLGIFYERR